MGASVSFNIMSPTISTSCFFLQYALRVASAASPCRPCSWVSTAVEASYLFLAGGWKLKQSSAFFGSPVSKVPYSQWCPATGTQIWKYQSTSVSAPLILRSLLTVSCNSATCCNRSSNEHTFCRFLHFLQEKGALTATYHLYWSLLF